jgi:hypothetical protein
LNGLARLAGGTAAPPVAARGSLTRRLAGLTALWVAVGLGLLCWFVVRTDERQIETAADARLTSLFDAVVASAAFDPASGPLLTRPLTDPEFDRPLSGYYWQLTGPGQTIATSRSLWDSRLAPPVPAAEVPEGGLRARNMRGPATSFCACWNATCRSPPARAPPRSGPPGGPGRRPARRHRRRDFRAPRQMVLAFVVLGHRASCSPVALLVVWGLRPLRRTQEELVEVREGRRLHMDIQAPSEIVPLVAEIEALIEQNRATVERARNHVGNLAHALKTPIAVLRNAVEAQDLHAAGQLATLERLVQHHLRRARAGALAGGAGAECAPLAVAEALATALRRLTAARGISIRVAGEARARLRADSQDFTEMLGNLMENACKYGRAQVEVRVAAAPPRPRHHHRRG